MFAVIRAGGRQYRVATDDVIEIDRIEGDVGSRVDFGEVLMVGGSDSAATVGGPLVEGASVTGEVVDQFRAKKVIAFKKRRRHNSRRKRGHRAMLTRVKIVGIAGAGGAAPAAAEA